MAMSANSDTGRTERSERERGVTTIVVVTAMIALLAAASLAIDVGMIWESRTQVQNAADGSALAGARQLLGVSGGVVDIPAAQAAAIGTGASNESVGNASLTILASDLEYGQWDFATRTLDTSVDLTDPNVVDAIRVTARMDSNANGPLTAIMAQIVGRTSFDVTADATAWLGFAANSLPGNIVMPIVIDCCKISGPQCDQDYCDYITANQPNSCPLDDPQAPDTGDVSCLEFFNTPDQNACWTEFDTSAPAVNTNDMVDIIQNGNPDEIDASEPIYVDNGTKTPIVDEIFDRFHGDGYFNGSPDGVDRYPPYDGTEDSWVVGLPVIECQTGINCAGGDPMSIVGFICFEIREVVVTPDKIIRGNFLCPTDPLWQECDIGTTTSGGTFGIRADIPVLVD
jgi:hypothetical protein